jgi:integrase
MASVFRRPATKYWAAGWYDAHGRFHLRSTKQVDRRKALSVAMEYERAERMTRDHLLTETTARRVLNDILERTGNRERLRMPTVRDWLAEWLTDKEANTSDDTAERYRSVKKSFLTYLADRAERQLASLTAHDVQGYITDYRTKGASYKTAHLHLATLHAAFDKARRLGLIASNPTDPIEVKAREGEQVERETFTPTEVSLLVQNAEGEWKTLLLLGYYTGARLSTCVNLGWSAVNLIQGKVSISRPGKKGKSVEIPIHPELQSHLETLASQDTPQDQLLPKLSGSDTGGKRGLSRQFKKLARHGCLHFRPGAAGGGGKQESLTAPVRCMVQETR